MGKSVGIFLCLSLFSEAGAEKLLLKEAATPAPVLQGYDVSVNRAPPFRVWQNDPALSDLYVRPGVTDLCVPATTLNTLLYQAYQRKPVTSGLPFAGVSPKGEVDSAELLRWFLSACSLPFKKSSLPDAVECAQKMFQEKLGSSLKARCIRPMQSGFGPDFDYQDRTPNLSDIRAAIESNHELIGVLAFEEFNSRLGKWVVASRHAINVWGISYKHSEPDRMVLYVQNSNREYDHMDFKTPVFDTIQLEASANGEIRVSTLEGELINFPGRVTKLIALMELDLSR